MSERVRGSRLGAGDPQAASPGPLDATELIKRVRRIQMRTAHRVSDALAGQYHSAFRGRGIEFEEVRPYQVGDDVRGIDWNVSARLGEPYVKLFREERELSVILVVDASGSTEFGTRGGLRRETIAEIAATVAVSAVRNADKVGLMLCADGAESWLPPRKGPRQVLRTIREILAFDPRGRLTRLGPALETLDRLLRRRAVVFVVGDFLDADPASLERSLRLLRRRHQVIPVCVPDPREREIPPMGLVEFRDAESGRRLVVDTGSAAVRRRFAAAGAEMEAAQARLFARLRLRPVRIGVGEDIVGPLMRRFARGRAAR